MASEQPAGADLARALESEFGVARALLTSRAALGLSSILECWRERRGICRVALPAAICHEVVVSVLAAQCEPIFCDVDPSDGLVTAPEWSRVRSLGADTAILVHLYGNPASARLVREIFPEPECLLIDDAAQAFGSAFEGALAGAGGDVGLLSFGATKQISTGNAALLFRNGDLAQEVSARLSTKAPVPYSARSELAVSFRARLDIARARLRTSGENARRLFYGLLQGLEPVLAVPYSLAAEAPTLRALAGFAESARARVEKKELWSSGLAGTGLQAVGMSTGCIPWRYTCRLPGLDWSGQHRIAQAIREEGVHVSNWYLPAHWFIEPSARSLGGVEALAREVFQFWLDEDTTLQAIERSCRIIRRIID